MQHTSEMEHRIDLTRPVDVFIWKMEEQPVSVVNPFGKPGAVRKLSYSGRCHGFSQESDSDGNSCVVAIVEKADGTVDTPSANCVQFTDVPKPVIPMDDLLARTMAEREHNARLVALAVDALEVIRDDRIGGPLNIFADRVKTYARSILETIHNLRS